MKATALLSLLLSILSGCKPDLEYPITLVVDAAHPELLETTLQAVDVWEAALPDNVSPFAGVTLSADKLTGCGTVWISVDPAIPDATGWSLEGRHRAVLQENQDCNRVIAVVPWATRGVSLMAHELGHQLGLDHNPNPASVMNSHPTTLDAIPEDVRAVVEFLGG